MKLIRDKSVPSSLEYFLRESARLRVIDKHMQEGTSLTNIGRDSFVASKIDPTGEKSTSVKDYLFNSLKL